MKKYTLSSLALLMAAATVSVSAGAETHSFSEAPKITVDFVNPKAYTDIESGVITTESDRQRVLRNLREAFQRNAERVIPNEYHLQVKVTDVDLAGAHEPERFNLDGVRIDREIYPPRIAFEFALLNSEGTVVAEGSESLKDLNYLLNPLRQFQSGRASTYEVAELVRSWARGKLAKQAKTLSS